MLILAFVLTLFSARQDIADEIQGSQRVGQLMTVLSALQDGATLEQHALRIDQLNRSETLRHFHVALLNNQGQAKLVSRKAHYLRRGHMAGHLTHYTHYHMPD
jgi:hypothetical protein